VAGLVVVLTVAAAAGEACARRVAGHTTHQTFEQSDEGWIPFGAGASVEVVRDPSTAKSGAAALALHYTIAPGQYGSTVLPLEAGEMTGLRRLELSVRTDHDTPVIVVLSEKQPGGGYYSSWFWCPKDRWLSVSLTPQDFVLDQGPSDPIDSDNRLDVDDIRGIGVTDLGQSFQTLGADYPLLIDKVSGSHTMLLDDVSWSTAPGAGPTGPWTDKVIGHPERGFVTWIALGGTRLGIVDADSPLGQRGFSAAYSQPVGRYIAVSHSLLDHDLRGVRRLTMTMASQHDASLMVYLEEKKPGSAAGPRYSHPVVVTGGSKPVAIDLLLSSFQPDASGMTDPDGKLDADQLKSISIIDITAAGSQTPSANVLWVSPITAR
jgi:hypothetical protein